MREEQALNRTDLVALTQESDALEESTNALTKFDVANAHCYDPNEEAKLRRVITAVGTEQFNQRVRTLAKKCRSMASLGIATSSSSKSRLKGLKPLQTW